MPSITRSVDVEIDMRIECSTCGAILGWEEFPTRTAGDVIRVNQCSHCEEVIGNEAVEEWRESQPESPDTTELETELETKLRFYEERKLDIETEVNRLVDENARLIAFIKESGKEIPCLANMKTKT
jgi:hypothetical protein